MGQCLHSYYISQFVCLFAFFSNENLAEHEGPNLIEVFDRILGIFNEKNSK